MSQPNSNYVKKEPLRLTLEDYHLMYKILNEIEPAELSQAEKDLKAKVLRISANIQKAMAYSLETGRPGDTHQAEEVKP